MCSNLVFMMFPFCCVAAMVWVARAGGCAEPEGSGRRAGSGPVKPVSARRPVPRGSFQRVGADGVGDHGGSGPVGSDIGSVDAGGVQFIRSSQLSDSP